MAILLVKVEEEWATAMAASGAALAEFRAATGAIVEQLKKGERVSEADWEREKTARTELWKRRETVARLAHRIRTLAEGTS